MDNFNWLKEIANINEKHWHQDNVIRYWDIPNHEFYDKEKRYTAFIKPTDIKGIDYAYAYNCFNDITWLDLINRLKRFRDVRTKNASREELIDHVHNDYNENPSPLQYKIGDQFVELGKEFTIQTPLNGTILDIKDVDGNIKGKIEFRQITELLLTPTLNLVTINRDVTGVSHSIVVNDVNAIYNTMNVSWQAGNHIVLNIIIEDLDIKNNDEHLELILNNLRKHEDYKANQYYMIISPKSGDFGGFAAPSLTDNWFVIQETYDKRIPAHELGHCSGLDEYAVNIGIVPSSRRNESSGQNMQYLTTNIMGYSKQGFSSANPLMDFYSWQIPKVRQQISIRINTGQ